MLSLLAALALVFAGAGMASQASTNRVLEASVQSSMLAIDDEGWKAMSEQSKLDFLRPVVELEAKALNLDAVPTLEVDDLPENMAGQYSAMGNVIRLDGPYLASTDGWTALLVVLHESFHAFQNKACTDPDAVAGSSASYVADADIEQWKRELSSYVSLEEDVEVYKAQQVEISADNYAQARIGKYKSMLSQAGR